MYGFRLRSLHACSWNCDFVLSRVPVHCLCLAVCMPRQCCLFLPMTSRAACKSKVVLAGPWVKVVRNHCILWGPLGIYLTAVLGHAHTCPRARDKRLWTSDARHLRLLVLLPAHGTHLLSNHQLRGRHDRHHQLGRTNGVRLCLVVISGWTQVDL